MKKIRTTSEVFLDLPLSQELLRENAKNKVPEELEEETRGILAVGGSSEGTGHSRLPNGDFSRRKSIL